MMHWSYAVGALFIGFTVGGLGTAFFLGAKITRILAASRRALGYLNNNSPRDAWQVLNQLMDEEDVP